MKRPIGRSVIAIAALTCSTSLGVGYGFSSPCSIRRNTDSSRSTASRRRRSAPRTTLASSTSNDIDEWPAQVAAEIQEVATCSSILANAFLQNEKEVTVEGILKICDTLDQQEKDDSSNKLVATKHLRRTVLKVQRYEWLVKLMKVDYQAYVATASFLSPSRIPRLDLPNVQDVPYNAKGQEQPTTNGKTDNGQELVADCTLDKLEYQESPLDKLLLSIFRKLVTKHSGGVTSDKAGMEGLLEQGRTYMLQKDQTPKAQHEMVKNTLGGLMTPFLPPFYRIFMSGIVPKTLGTDYDGKQIGPWFYAPFLTSFVTPTFFGFLVGPSYVNRRKDGQLGGLVVEKCKFLQESGCKGLCLHQCKLPAQEFFQDELGLSLTVSPNFDTQECQWSFGEKPLSPADDPSFPKGCLVGCESRQQLVDMGSKADACN